MRRFLILLFPWLAARRIRLLIESPKLYGLPAPSSQFDQGWNNGYERALYEIAHNLGLED